MISIIIPAYNEEEYLGRLLESVERQEVEAELILAYTPSQDDTKKIAAAHGCKIVVDRRRHPIHAKQKAAKKAAHDLLFIEADVVLPDGFLKAFLQEIDERELDIAGCYVSCISDRWQHHAYFALKNFFNRIFRQSAGQLLFIRKGLFDRVGGYNTNLYLGEDHDLVRRARRYGRYGYLDLRIATSARRLEKEGTLGHALRSQYSEWYRKLVGPITHDKRPYDYEKGQFRGKDKQRGR